MVMNCLICKLKNFENYNWLIIFSDVSIRFLSIMIYDILWYENVVMGFIICYKYFI